MGDSEESDASASEASRLRRENERLQRDLQAERDRAQKLREEGGDREAVEEVVDEGEGAQRPGLEAVAGGCARRPCHPLPRQADILSV